MKINLTTRIFIGMLLGILVGHFYRMYHPDQADYENFANNIQILSDIFLRLIKMIIAPLVFATLVVGVAKVFIVRLIRMIHSDQADY
ncbi:MAG TPA: cation:dicarboxylase symporter family transporter, partial [Bacteroidia bacterium]|nr:cation:dicarboxylase symporter family transporter [Bacteroidia bacterium]